MTFELNGIQNQKKIPQKKHPQVLGVTFTRTTSHQKMQSDKVKGILDERTPIYNVLFISHQTGSLWTRDENFEFHVKATMVSSTAPPPFCRAPCCDPNILEGEKVCDNTSQLLNLFRHPVTGPSTRPFTFMPQVSPLVPGALISPVIRQLSSDIK